MARPGLSLSRAMDDLLPPLGVALLVVGLGLPLGFWLLIRFPMTTGAVGLVAAVVELLSLLGAPGEPLTRPVMTGPNRVCPSHPDRASEPPCGASPAHAIPRARATLFGTGRCGPKVRL